MPLLEKSSHSNSHPSLLLPAINPVDINLRFATLFIHTDAFSCLTLNSEGEARIEAETVMVIDNSDEEVKNDTTT